MMARPELAQMRFVRALLPDHAARREGSHYSVQRPDRVARLGCDKAAQLAALGALTLAGGVCVAGPRARDWLAAVAALARGPDPEAPLAPAVLVSLDESPLARLALARGGEAPFLAPHQVAAGERLRKLVERARLSPRLTMSYDATRTAGGKKSATPAELSDAAVDARRQLDEVARLLPADCRGVVFDVCGLLKGLQTVETERGWPRRSAKMVLRIALEQLAAHWGLSEAARGRDASRIERWFGERLPLIG